MIEIRNLTQTYKSGKGIFDINFTIKEGEVFGYLDHRFRRCDDLLRQKSLVM